MSDELVQRNVCKRVDKARVNALSNSNDDRRDEEFSSRSEEVEP
jgi:hypothetical protein